MGVAVNAESRRGGSRDARVRLVEAAIEAFAAKGFHGTTTRDIAAAAGMSPAALYVHHRTKEELLHLISSEGHARTLALCEDAVARDLPPRRQLDVLVEAFVRHHAVNHTSARVVNYELAALTDEHRAVIEEQRRAIERVVRELIERGVAAGELTSADPRLTAAAVISLGVDVARWYDGARGLTPDAVAEHYVLLVRRMLGVETR